MPLADFLMGNRYSETAQVVNLSHRLTHDSAVGHVQSEHPIPACAGGGSPLSQSWVASFWIKSLKNTIQDNWVGSSFGVGFWTAPCNFVGAINTPRDMWQGLPTFPAFAATLGFHQQFQGFEGNTMLGLQKLAFLKCPLVLLYSWRVI